MQQFAKVILIHRVLEDIILLNVLCHS